MAQYPASINVLTLNGTNGFRITGEAVGDAAGSSVAYIGDFNKDGFADFLIGAPFADPQGLNSGATYLVLGNSAGFGSVVGAKNIGFEIQGISSDYRLGSAIAAAGDVNNDGHADILMVAPGSASSNGVAYITYGIGAPFAPYPIPGSATAGAGVVGFVGGQYAGGGNAQVTAPGTEGLKSAVSAGDINGDGFADMMFTTSGTGNASSGLAYVIMGSAKVLGNESINLGSMGATGFTGFKLQGVANAGKVSAASAGDINGDGFADMIIGTPNTNKAYVVFGKSTAFATTLDVTTLNGTNGFSLTTGASDALGSSVSSAGDVNGDGYADFLIGAPKTAPVDGGSGNGAGAAYLVFGKAGGYTASFDLTTLNGTTGFKITGDTAQTESVGVTVAAAGDVNGDGFADLLVTAPNANAATDPDGPTSGAVFVVFGKASGFAASLNLYALNGSDGFKIYAPQAGLHLGGAAAAGDINNDGLDDVILNGTQSANGDTYVVYGRQPDSAVNRTGSNAAQKLVGGSFNDTLSGLGGNDTLFGNGGADIMSGGTGNDTLYGGAGDDLIAGDDGNDTLTGGAGDDIINGDAGIDTAIFSGTRASYILSRVSDGARIVTGPDGRDVVTGVEQLQFSNMTLANSLARSDFNGDGYSDIALQNDGGPIGLWLMNGTTIVSNPIVSSARSDLQIKSTADYSGDGKADLMMQRTDGNVEIWNMNGSTVLTSTVYFTAGTGLQLVGSGDFNGDGASELLLQSSNGQTAIARNNALDIINIGVNQGAAWHIVGSGDFNGDNKADIVFEHDDGRVSMWLMNDTTVLSSPILGGSPDPDWHIVSTGDFDGNGEADLLWQNTNGQVAIWMMDGANILSEVNVGTNPGAAVKVKGTADLNGDGKADILFQNTNGQISAWMMSGTTILSQPNLGSNPGTAWHAIAGNGG